MAKTFVKLGPKAGGFSDPYSGFKIHRGQVKELETQEQKTSGKIKAAIRGGHLEKVSEKDYKDYLKSIEKKGKKPTGPVKTKEDILKEELGEMTRAELLEYYKEHYEVDEDEEARFDALKLDERIEELVKLAADEDEDED